MEEEISSNEMAADILCEFIEVFIHSVLHIRKIYPSGVFVRKKKYGIPIYMSCHPELNDYISNCITSLHPLLVSDKIAALAVVILGPSKEQIEQFVLEIAEVKSDILPCTHNMSDIERELRTLCIKIGTATGNLKPLPKGAHFSIQIYCKPSVKDSPQREDVDENFTWIAAAPQKTSLENSLLIPLKLMNTTLFKMQLFVQTKELADT